MIYTAAGSVSLSGNSTVTLTAPTGGPYNGVGLFQARSDTSAVNLSGNAYLSCGTLYAPRAALILSGNSNPSAPIVVDELSLSGNADPSPTPATRRFEVAESDDVFALALLSLTSPSPLAADLVFLGTSGNEKVGLASSANETRVGLWPLSPEDLTGLAGAYQEANRLNGNEEWAALLSLPNNPAARRRRILCGRSQAAALPVWCH